MSLGRKCIVCGWDHTDFKGVPLVEGAHVRPHRSGDEFDRQDNIIPLCPNHHTEFDHYNFYIDADTMKLVFFDSNSEFHGKDVSKEIYYIKREFIAYEQYLYLKAHKT